MATYKVIQDIEAEDHIIGPLSLRQFIFALISVFCLYICFLLLTKGVGILIILFLPPAIFFGFFAIPFGRDQSTEIWALAKIRFWFKPRRRIWDQSGIKELVTITAPKKIERILTNSLTEHEVESRLKVLANTLDSRGWAVKNANVYSAPNNIVSSMADTSSDRLIDVNSIATAVPDDSIADQADVLDENQSTLAQHFNQMIDQSTNLHRQELIEQMNSQAPTSQLASSTNQWFMPQQTQSKSPEAIYAPDVASQDETPEEVELATKIKAEHQMEKVFSSNLRTLQPISASPQITPPVNSALPTLAQDPVSQSALTDKPDAAILSLANNNDFTVDTIAREAKRSKGEDTNSDEVVISLH